MSEPIPYVPGRSCANCTMCCKLLGIVELNKPHQTVCPNCNAGRSCRIYADRPQSCRNFVCAYLLTPLVPEYWKPAASKMVLEIDVRTQRISVHVDAARKDAWKREPYYSDIKRWAANNAIQAGWIVVYQGLDAIVVSATRDQNIGPVGPDQMISVVERFDDSGRTFHAAVVNKSEARA